MDQMDNWVKPHYETDQEVALADEDRNLFNRPGVAGAALKSM